MSINDGTAHEVEPGRLTAFEDAGGPDVTFNLPPRPGRARQLVPSPVTEPSERPGPTAHSVALVETVPERPIRSEKAAARKKAPAPTPDPGTKGPESRVRPSNVHIPVALLEPIARTKSDHGLSNGEIIISSIEGTYADLKDLIHPAVTAGGNLFASRRSRASRANDGPLTPLNYRLREEDYATLDRLVDEFGASSRGHLITVALTAYLSPTS
jgi:hypothetical protein